jgi:hypothetical protein
LVDQVTCGRVGIERAVVIPKTLFALMLHRLDELSTEKHKANWLQRWEARGRLQEFLTTRCSAEFLSLYIKQHPKILDDVSQPGLYLYAVSEVGLAVRLHACGLLPEDRRRKFISKVTEYAVNGEHVSALTSPRIRKLFTDNEFKKLRTRVRKELLPKIGEVRRDLQSNRSSDQSAEEYMEPLLDSLNTLMTEFGSNPKVESLIELEIELAQEWITENTGDDSEDKPGRKLGNVRSSDRSNEGRSIFDDVDT